MSVYFQRFHPEAEIRMSSGESTTTLTPDRKEKLLSCIKNGLLNFPIYHISLLNYKVHDPKVTCKSAQESPDIVFSHVIFHKYIFIFNISLLSHLPYLSKKQDFGI